jgi:hypothetical protein
MKYRYSLVDDESDLVIGYCNKMDGLTGKSVERDNGLFHNIVLFDFVFCDDFKMYLKKRKERFSRLIYINILDDNMNIIAQFSFASHTDIRHTEFYTLNSHINFEIIGYLNEVATKNELKLWHQWILNFPIEKNKWIDLDYGGKRDWLRMLRIMSCCRYNEVVENKNKIFYLDGRNITTYDSFFIAFAEALNGPGTYFGDCLGGLDDCLCGGFGITPPFKVIWENSSVAVKHLDEAEWRRHRLYLKKYNKKIFYNDDNGIVLNLNIFQSIINTLLSRGVEVVLIP